MIHCSKLENKAILEDSSRGILNPLLKFLPTPLERGPTQVVKVFKVLIMQFILFRALKFKMNRNTFTVIISSSVDTYNSAK